MLTTQFGKAVVKTQIPKNIKSAVSRSSVGKRQPDIQVYLPKNERSKVELSNSSISLNDRAERLSKFKEEKKATWKQRIEETSKSNI